MLDTELKHEVRPLPIELQHLVIDLVQLVCAGIFGSFYSSSNC